MSSETHDAYCPTFKDGHCPDHCVGGNDDNPGHAFKFYELAPELSVAEAAKYVSVCDQCAEVRYLKELPEGADLIGLTRGNA